MISKKFKLVCNAFIALLILGFTSCSNEGEGEKLFKTLNEDENDFLVDAEFNRALAEMAYFETWDENNDTALTKNEWEDGVTAYLGGYQISTVKRFENWDLNGDNKLTEEEFREELFEVVDKDDNNQISESEFLDFYSERGQEEL